MISFDILTLFPEMFPGVLEKSILGRAVSKELLFFNYVNIRDFSTDKHNRVDDYPYGGGCGMVMQAEPIYKAYQSVLKRDKKPLTVYLSPRGRKFNQEIAKEMAKEEQIVLLCGHYEGVDQRIIDEICDYELSVGDFVLTGGELGAMIVCDAVSRLIPGVLSEEEGFKNESHYNGLLEYPQYTRPPVWNDREVPGVLLSGNQQEIDKWRHEQALKITEISRPDMFEISNITSFSNRNKSDANISSFYLASFSSNDENKDKVYKVRRKISRKLKAKGFVFNEINKVISDVNELVKVNNDLPLVVVSLEEINGCVTPTLVLGDREDNSSLYPYYLNLNSQNLLDKLLEFLSIVKTIKKYTK